MLVWCWMGQQNIELSVIDGHILRDRCIISAFSKEKMEFMSVFQKK